MFTDVVKNGYNQIAHVYQQERKSLKSDKFLNKFLAILKPQSLILDLGCGSGDPVDISLIKKDHLVIGLDISAVQINLAKKNCPRASYTVRNILTLGPQEFSVDAVISLYTIFHIPREEHVRLLRTVNSFLPIGGVFLLTMGDTDFEGTHMLFGVPMWSSQYGPQKNIVLLQQAGFEILDEGIIVSARERHQFILAKKMRPS